MESRQLKLYLWGAALTYLVVQTKALDMCEMDSNCTASNTVCVSGVCQCHLGFTFLNGQCNQVLGRTCLDNLDCDDGRTVCTNSKCQCMSRDWREFNGRCVSYYGETCDTWTNCGLSPRYKCTDKLCRCNDGYKYTNDSCEKVLGSYCNLNKSHVDCPLDNALCRVQYHWGGMRCQCSEGYTEKDDQCIQVLGSSCEDVKCGNPLHYSYEYLSTIWDYLDWGYYYHMSYHLHLSCNINNVCACDHGFVADGSACVPAIGRWCLKNGDCGNYPGYSCDENNTCTCSAGFQPRLTYWTYNANRTENSDYWWYDWYGNDVTLCIPVIGQSCDDVTCSVMNSNCSQNNTCLCNNGYTETNTGLCEQVLGMSCLRDTLCQIVNGGTCGRDNICVCKEGFTQNGIHCQQGSSCSADDHCQLENSVCVSEKCTCSSGFQKFESRCLRADCAVHVPVLPDLHRRSVNHVSVKDEPVIDDVLLAEGWYSIGKYDLHVSQTDPDKGHCSAYYPIYLKESLSPSQLESMKTGNLSVCATVGGLEYGESENIGITLRKCGEETQIFFQRPKTHFAGLCLNISITPLACVSIVGDDRVHSVTRSSGMYALVVPDLLFAETHENNRTKYSPYTVFSCLPSEVMAKTSTTRYPHSFVENSNDIFFYYVHWYINEVHFKSKGPVRRSNFVTKTSLFEDDILDAGFALGFKIRCSFEIAENPNGIKTLIATSEDFLTGFKEISVTLDRYTYYAPLRMSSDTPLGCEAFEDDNARNCELEWPILNEKGESVCNISQRGQTGIKACSFTILGFTKTGYANNWGSWQYEWNRYYGYTHISNETHEITINEYYQTHIDIVNSSTQVDFRIKFKNASESTGHKLWDGYKMPAIKVREERNFMVQEICNITMLNVPVITMDLSSKEVLMDTTGEFVLYRSRLNPVEIHVHSEVCTSSVGEFCICGVTYRNGDNIYTFNYCNAFARIGQIYGVVMNRDDKDVLLINGMVLTIYAREGKITALGLGSNHSKETLDAGEGLCTFSSGSFKYRNGTVMSTSTDFVTSWRNTHEESLLNPKNHKSFAWNDDYSLCYCPFDAKDREIIYYYNSTDYYNNKTRIDESANIYRGYFRCSDENYCSETHEGEEWPDSASPSFSYIKVKSRIEIRYQGVSPLLYLFCDFEKQNGFLYRIQWNLDGDEIYKSDAMGGTKADGFFINNYNFTTTKFLLESGFSCVVSVYNDSQSMLFEARSEEIRAFDIVRTELLLPRGGDTTIQLKISIPFVCPKGTPCHFDFKLFDPSEWHNCTDSTIAIKDQNTCGKRIIGVHSESEVVNNKATVVNITLTTKNNDLYTLRNTFTLRLKFVTNGATSTFQERTFSKQITVFVRDDERYWQSNYCYANNDPRMRTFDGQYYSNMLVDEFVMMKHKRLPVEVQLETINGWYSCGVTVRAGRDVFTINHCHGDHVTGYLLADDKILKVKKRDEHRYQIYLPHGTMIDVMISSWAAYMVNVYIYPSPADMKQVEGLCGDFDGNVKGDLIHSDGNVTHFDYYYWWWYISDPHDFIRSWGLGSTNSTYRSLTDIDVIEETLESWFVNDVLCVCTGNDGNGEVKCSANEQNTCVTPVDKPGDDVSIVVRQKRSGHVLEKEYKQRMRKMKERREANRNSETHNIRPRSIGNVQDAIDSCNLTLSSSCGIMSVKDDGLNVTFEELVYNCGQDRAASPDTDWTALTCQVMEANVEKELRVDVEFKEKHPELVSEILQNLCVGNCSGNGKCVQGSCECFAGYKASDCSLDLSKRVVIKGITGDGVCDVTKYDCTCIRLTTSGSLSTSTYTLEHKQINTDGVWSTKGISNGTVVYDNFNEVFVCPNIKRTKRSVEENSVIADQYVIALSNDNTTFGDSSTVFVMDSTCLSVTLINGSHSIELLPGFCIIGGVCYRSNSQSPSDSCLICVESANPYHWSRDDIDSCKDAQKVDGGDTTGIQPYLMGIIAGAAGFVVVVVVIVVAVCIVKKKLAARVGAFEGQLYDTPKNTAFQQYPLREDGKSV